jgi:hypothetical protein
MKTHAIPPRINTTHAAHALRRRVKRGEAEGRSVCFGLPRCIFVSYIKSTQLFAPAMRQIHPGTFAVDVLHCKCERTRHSA